MRSDKALKDYFSSLFPNRVHSAVVALTLSELDTLSERRQRVTRRLEKSIAYFYATRKRATHAVGRCRLNCCGIESNPFGCCARSGDYEGDYDDLDAEPPVKGQRVDSVQYYTVELLEMNAQTIELQKIKKDVAETGNDTAKNWFERVLDGAAGLIGMEEGEGDTNKSVTCPQLNELTNTSANLTVSSFNEKSKSSISSADNGSVLSTHQKSDNERNGSDTLNDPLLPNKKVKTQITEKSSEVSKVTFDRSDALVRQSTIKFPGDRSSYDSHTANTMYNVLEIFGYDFLRDSCVKLFKDIDHYVDHLAGNEMSSTGFVTFKSLVSVTYANRVLLTHKPNALFLQAAPEPRDIIWKNLHLEINIQKGKESIANFLVFLGALLWSIPLTLIQAVATAESLSEAPGMDWILTYKGGLLANFINGYLPVIALLCLIQILPKIFEWIAKDYENRKTRSDVQVCISLSTLGIVSF